MVLLRANTVIADYLRRHHHGRYYALGQNLMREVCRAYDRALEDVDILVMPTMPTKAPRLPGPDDDRLARILATQHLIANTAPFCGTWHPAVSAPCGMSHGLPIGMQLAARRGEDELLLRVTAAFERHVYAAPSP